MYIDESTLEEGHNPKTRSISVGDLFENKYGSIAEVVYYKNIKEVWVEFLGTGYVRSCWGGDLKRGKFKDPFASRVYGKGYYGLVSNTDKKSSLYKKAYNTWCGALERCYSEKFHEKYPTYKECTISEDWLCFADFFSWFKEQKGCYEKGFQLDKDILIRGNKVYSPSTCCLVPCSINNVILDNSSSKGKYKRGVAFDKRKGVFQASISIRNKPKTLGIYRSEDLASQAYLEAKKSLILELANQWKPFIEEQVYQALLSWSLDE